MKSEDTIPENQDTYLKFLVMNKLSDKQDPIVLGSALIPVRDLINSKEPATSRQLLLLKPNKEGKGIDDYKRLVGGEYKEEEDENAGEDLYYSDPSTHAIAGTLKIKTLFIAD